MRAPIQTSPLQKPMAKLLYQRTSGGRGQRQRLSNAGSMSENNMKFVRSEVRKLCRKPVLDVVIPVSSSAERVSVFLVERQVLKNRPVNRPVRKMNSRMDPIFRMVKSPFNMWFDTRICSLSF